MRGPDGTRFRLFRSESDRKISGVAGGMAEALDVDPTLVRLLWVLVVIVTSGVGLLAYLAMWLIVPLRSDVLAGTGAQADRADPVAPPAESGTGSSGELEPTTSARRPSNAPVVAGVVLIVVGVLFLLDNWVSLQYWSYIGDLIALALRFWPLILVAAGALLIYSRLRR